jgi:hypothetical protein
MTQIWPVVSRTRSPTRILLTDAVGPASSAAPTAGKSAFQKRGSSIELNHIGTERISAFHQS